MMRMENIQGTGRGVDVRKLVIKVGSAVIAGEQGGMDLAALASLADSVARLRERGVQAIIVSSGAIGMGRGQFPEFKPHTIPDRQALAAVGQVGLMHMYKTLFNERGFRAAQILLTHADMADRGRYLNARHTMERLLELGVVPVVNENDTVTVDEIKFGDNDELSAIVATKLDADLLVILSVVEGLYRCHPPRPGDGGEDRLIRVVNRLDDAILAMAGKSRSELGTGGMQSKLQALGMASHAGVHAAIACGKTPGILDEILTGTFRGTYFVPAEGRRFRGRDRWIAYGQKAFGRQLIVDEGACRALTVGKKSLLAAGVRGVRGDFKRGDLVEVLDLEGRRIAKGLVNYASEEIERIQGHKTGQIHAILGYHDYDEVIHRDNLVVLG